MVARQQHSDEIKTAALIAIQAGEEPISVAERYGVPVGTVHSWMSRHRQGGGSPGDSLASLASLASDDRGRVGVLVMEYLEASLKALRAQVDVCSDSDWIKKQSAGEIAVLHGTIGDRAVRLLEALGGPQEERDSDPAI